MSPMSSIEMRTITVVGRAAQSRRAVSSPSMPGIRTSSSTRSGSSSEESRSASSPEAASPTVSKPGVASTTAAAAVRKSG
jgi:hypothetical protein